MAYALGYSKKNQVAIGTLNDGYSFFANLNFGFVDVGSLVGEDNKIHKTLFSMIKHSNLVLARVNLLLDLT